MVNIKNTIKLFCFAGLFLPNQVKAQTDSIQYTIQTIKVLEPRLNSSNPSNINYLPIIKISEASIGLTKTNGDFINYHESNNSLTYTVNTQSFYRLNTNLVVSGSISYANFRGKNMSGSVFIDPYKNPFDIVELTTANAGTKGLEIYNLQGIISNKLSERFTIGGQINYEASNYTKYKDLRHINTLLDMDVKLGGLYKLSDSFELGLTYNYKRRIESVSFGAYGNVDKNYQSLINYGGFLGWSELYGNAGYTGDGAVPLNSVSQGGGFQFNYKINNNVSLNNEFGYSKLNGKYGNDGSASIIFSEHHGEQYVYDGNIQLKGPNTTHNISLNATYTTLKNYENVYVISKVPNEASRINYYGQSEVLDKQLFTGKLELNSLLAMGKQSYYHINLGAIYFRKIQTISLYPFYRDQEINTYKIYGSINKNHLKKQHQIGYIAGLSFGSGFGNPYTDSFYTQPATSQEKPISLNNALYKEYEFFTNPNLTLTLGSSYQISLRSKVKPFVKIENSLLKAMNTTFNGNYKNVLNLHIGCYF